MWRSVCALIAAAWFFAGLVFSLNPLLGLGFLALSLVDWGVLLDDGPAIRLAPRDPDRPADD